MIRRIEDEAPEALERHRAPGAAVAIVVGGEAVWSGGFGLADVEEGAPVTADTVFETASVAKPVTGWGVLKLAEQGLIDLDAPIETYLSRWQLPESEFDHSLVTPRRILSHSAGLSGGGDPGVQPGEPVPSLEEAADGAGMEGGAIRVVASPGEAYRYSSKGYLLLEMAIEEVGGEPFADFMQREVLDPLGMTSSRYDWTPELRSRAAVGYDWYNRPQPSYEHATHAQGGLVATAGDLGRFVAATMPGPEGEPAGRGVLSPGSVRETFEPVVLTEDETLAGLGYNLDKSSDVLVARKTGDHRGWKSFLAVAPEMGAGIVILTNSDRAAAGVFADIACPWSEELPEDPLRGLCAQMYLFRDVQLGLARILVALSLIYGAIVISGLRRGRRSFDPSLSAWRRLRLAGLLVLVASWWLFWYTDWPLRLAGYPPTFVTVRFDPWPTAFIWVSGAVTLLLLVLAAATFAPACPPPRAGHGLGHSS